MQFEVGLGLSEGFYSWAISVSNIGSFLGSIVGMVSATILPYWFGFMISLACHIIGFLLYAVVTHGWMLITGRLLVGVFNRLYRSLTFAYFAVTYEYYISEHQESKEYCRIKDVLFSLMTVSTSLGYLIGTGMSICNSMIVWLVLIEYILKGSIIIHDDGEIHVIVCRNLSDILKNRSYRSPSSGWVVQCCYGVCFLGDAGLYIP